MTFDDGEVVRMEGMMETLPSMAAFS